MSARRSTRERKKPKEIYEVEDRRKDASDDEEGDAEEQERGATDEEEADGDDNSDDDDGDDEDDFELNERKPAASPKVTPKKRGRPANKQQKAVKPRKLKPVQEEGRQRKKQQKAKPTRNGDGEDEDNAAGEVDEDEDEDDVFFGTWAPLSNEP